MKHTKNTFRPAILFLAFLSTILTFANNEASSTIKYDAKKTEISLGKVKKGSSLSIKNSNGIVLFKEFLDEADAYTKEFDLTTLPNGAYVFEVDKGLTISVTPFTVKANLVSFNKEKEDTIYKPLARVSDNVVYISKLALNNAPLKLEIYFTGFKSDERELILSETLKDPKTIERVYKLTGLGRGTYKIKMYTEGRTFVKYIN